MTHPTARAADPLALLLLAAWLAAEAVLPLVAAAVALLLTVAGWRPAAQPRIPRTGDPQPPAKGDLQIPAQGMPLADLRVLELRRLARAAGHRQLARSGRRADLLAALAIA
jgi:hypothetical protein